MDKDAEKVTTLRAGKMPIYEPGLEEMVRRNHGEERLSFTTDLPAAVKASEIVFIAVGTPQGEDGSADLTHVLDVARAVGRALDKYTVVVDKSTVPVGTAKRVQAAIAKETTQPFSVVSNPEFLKQGAAVEDFMKPDRVVIGVEPGDDRAGAVMKELYGPFTRTGAPIMMMDTASAELSKYAANSILASRISFMNEVANMCELVGADVDQVRKAIGADRRIGTSFLFPGVGYGGSCFPKDVKALLKSGQDHGYDFKILHAVEGVNDAQKERLVAKMLAHFGSLKGKTIAVWGLAFKPRTDDMREAPAIVIIEGLLAAGRHRPRLRSGGDRNGALRVWRSDHALRQELRRADRRRRARRGHRVEHVPRAGLRQDARADAVARRVRRPQHLFSRADAGARLQLFLHWPVSRARCW